MGTGKKLQTVLKEKNISIASLSRETGISSNTLYALIKRDSNINAVTLNKIADALHLTIDELNDLLTKDVNEKENLEPELLSLDIDFVDTLTDAQEILKKLNEATIAYQHKVMQYDKLCKTIEDYTHKKNELENKISRLQSDLDLLKIDLKNRQLELHLLHSKFKQ